MKLEAFERERQPHATRPTYTELPRTKCIWKKMHECFFKAYGKFAMKPREGDLIETADGNIFDVKGLVHPPDRIIAFIRFTPDVLGERRRGNVQYRKVYPLHERYTLLKERFPQYLVRDQVFNECLCEVPRGAVKKHYNPSEFLNKLRRRKTQDELGEKTLKLAQLLQEHSSVERASLGVSGSLLAGLHTPSSDIDLIVYGSSNGWKIYHALQSLIDDEASQLRRYTIQELKTLFDFRSKDTAMDFEDFVRTESRKVLQGKFCQRDYFIRCIKEWNEVKGGYGSVRYESVGEAQIKATIAEDSEMILTPCTYWINNIKLVRGKIAEPLLEIVSFRGRFCEQARKGEKVIAQGKLERVQESSKEEYFRLLLGNKPSDFMILA